MSESSPIWLTDVSLCTRVNSDGTIVNVFAMGTVASPIDITTAWVPTGLNLRMTRTGTNEE